MMGWMAGMTWMNPPPVARVDGEVLHVVTGDATDFWSRTFYGFTHHNGHFLGRAAEAEFACEVWFTGAYAAQYDQAGLMLHGGPEHWVKCGIEHVNGVPHLAVVVTRGVSDWCQMAVPGVTGAVGLRMVRKGDAVWVQADVGAGWVMLRLAGFPPEVAARVGVMCCSPSRAGFEVAFERFSLNGAAGERPY